MIETTVTTDRHVVQQRGAGDEATLTLVHHRDPTIPGVRRVIERGATLQLGRGGASCMPGAFDDPKISREHAVIRRVEEVIRLEDLQSRNGTFVNGRRVAAAELTPGDVVSMGDVVLLLHRAPLLFREPRHPSLLGVGAALSDLLEQLGQVGPRDTTVLIVGETGVGKELVATELHARSRRRGRLVAVNCAGLPDTLLASELFGHVRGAFTGADRPRQGLIEAARDGTLFLDEIAEASPAMQSALLRLFETGEYRPLGSDRVLKVEGRFVAATQPDIRGRIDAGRFRLDLYARLARWEITVPPLRERREDIPTLARAFAMRFAGAPVALAVPLVVALLRHDWRGNVRELLATMERLVVSAPDPTALDVTPWLRSKLAAPATDEPAAKSAPATGVPAGAAPRPAAPRPAALAARVERPTREALEGHLERCGGRIRRVAIELGVSRKTIYRWATALDVDMARFRDEA